MRRLPSLDISPIRAQMAQAKGFTVPRLRAGNTHSISKR
jgi:hypothetical protein